MKRGSPRVSTASVPPFSPSLLLLLSPTRAFFTRLVLPREGLLLLPSPSFLRALVSWRALPFYCLAKWTRFVRVSFLRAHVLVTAPVSRSCGLVIPRCPSLSRQRVRQLTTSCRPRWARCRLRARPSRLPARGDSADACLRDWPGALSADAVTIFHPVCRVGGDSLPRCNCGAGRGRRFSHPRARAWGWSPWRRHLDSARPSLVVRRAT